MTLSSPKRKSRRRSVIRVAVVVVLALAIVCFRMVTDIGRDPTPEDRWVVIKIIDGDTVFLSGGDELRLANIDTPEEDEPFYEDARQFLSELALGKTVRVEFSQRRRDKYGRLLGCMFIDSVMAGEAILERGLGYILLFRDTDLDRPEVQRLLGAQRRAVDARVGLHSLERTPEEYYVSRYGRFRVHRPGCNEIKRLDPTRNRLYETREEALYAGLTPCRRCRP